MFFFFYFMHNQIADNLCEELTSVKEQLKSMPKTDILKLVEKALNLTCQIYLSYINAVYLGSSVEYISEKELLSRTSLECLNQWESSKKQNVKILAPVFTEIAEILRKNELKQSDKEHAEKFANTIEQVFVVANRNCKCLNKKRLIGKKTAYVLFSSNFVYQVCCVALMLLYLIAPFLLNIKVGLFTYFSFLVLIPLFVVFLYKHFQNFIRLKILPPKTTNNYVGAKNIVAKFYYTFADMLPSFFATAAWTGITPQLSNALKSGGYPSLIRWLPLSFLVTFVFVKFIYIYLYEEEQINNDILKKSFKNNSKQIFISYSSKEANVANKVKTVLEHNSINCWMAPKSISPGSNYTKEIPTAIKGSQTMVLILSKKSQESKWVAKEVETALKNNVPVIPFHIDNSILNAEFDFMISQNQRIDAYNRLSEAFEELIDRLL